MPTTSTVYGPCDSGSV